MSETKLVRRGDAVPVDPDTGAPAYDAPAATDDPTREPTAAVLAQDPESAEAKQAARVDDTNVTWPRRHAALDELAAEHGLTFSVDGLTVDEKIAELKSMNITPEAT